MHAIRSTGNHTASMLAQQVG